MFIGKQPLALGPGLVILVVEMSPNSNHVSRSDSLVFCSAPLRSMHLPIRPISRPPNASDSVPWYQCCGALFRHNSVNASHNQDLFCSCWCRVVDHNAAFPHFHSPPVSQSPARHNVDRIALVRAESCRASCLSAALATASAGETLLVHLS